MCEEISKPINTMILGKILPACQFASATLYRSGQVKKAEKACNRKLKLQIVIVMCNLQFIMYNL